MNKQKKPKTGKCTPMGDYKSKKKLISMWVKNGLPTTFALKKKNRCTGK